MMAALQSPPSLRRPLVLRHPLWRGPPRPPVSAPHRPLLSRRMIPRSPRVAVFVGVLVLFATVVASSGMVGRNRRRVVVKTRSLDFTAPEAQLQPKDSPAHCETDLHSAPLDPFTTRSVCRARGYIHTIQMDTASLPHDCGDKPLPNRCDLVDVLAWQLAERTHELEPRYKDLLDVYPYSDEDEWWFVNPSTPPEGCIQVLNTNAFSDWFTSSTLPSRCGVHASMELPESTYFSKKTMYYGHGPTTLPYLTRNTTGHVTAHDESCQWYKIYRIQPKSFNSVGKQILCEPNANDRDVEYKLENVCNPSKWSYVTEPMLTGFYLWSPVTQQRTIIDFRILTQMTSFCVIRHAPPKGHIRWDTSKSPWTILTRFTCCLFDRPDYCKSMRYPVRKSDLIVRAVDSHGKTTIVYNLTDWRYPRPAYDTLTLPMSSVFSCKYHSGIETIYLGNTLDWRRFMNWLLTEALSLAKFLIALLLQSVLRLITFLNQRVRFIEMVFLVLLLWITTLGRVQLVMSAIIVCAVFTTLGWLVR